MLRYKFTRLMFLEDKFIEVAPFAVGMFSVRDLLQEADMLSYDVSNIELAKAVRAKLDKTRELPEEELDRLLESDELDSLTKKDFEQFKKEYGYRSIKTVQKMVRMVDITQESGVIEIMETHQNALDGFNGLNSIEYPETITDEELGQALREAFGRCTSKFS